MKLVPFRLKRGVFPVAGFLAAYLLFISVISAYDFGISADDLISKEAYRKISMDFKDASLKNVLKIFSEQAGLNFIASQTVLDRTLTLYLDGVPLQEALKKIMSANNLKYELEAGGRVFIVKESGRPDVDLVTKIYRLKYARLKSSRLESAIASGAGEGGAAGGGADQSGGNIEDAVKGVMSSASGANFAQDARTNSLIITDVPESFEVIEKVISLLDLPAPQVMIEVEILDVSKKSIDDMGVTFASDGSLMSLAGSSADTRFPNFFADGKTLDPPTFTYGTLSAAVFQATLNLLRTDTKTRFLARPRILTMSNETADIKIETDEAIGKTKETSGEGSASSSTEKAERAPTGVSLKVTPQVDLSGGNVTMFIVPSVSQAKFSTITVNGEAVKDVEKRSSQTTLMVKNGETIVVGGLIRTNDETTVNKIPVLGDIPIIGALFRHKDKTVEERELIVFITPHIIGGNDAVALARADIPSMPLAPFREQSSLIARKEQIDNMLERWEN
ncbi:MAG TPA: hypothetical protein DCL35_03730 [Candidatus Omnitrophica bacterium]|nr:hypothetical protein [Candidatus Omnitrophota bacterium]